MTKLDTLRGILAGREAVVFDFDNIIVDSEPCHYEAYARVFARHGHTINRDEYWVEWTSKGGGAEGEIHRYNLDADPCEIRREKDPIYSEFCRSGAIRPFPDALRVIASFHALGLSLGIASGSYERDIRAILAANGLDRYFAAIVGKDNIRKYKPDPETFLRGAEALGISPERCVAVEDAEKGIRSAKGAGMAVILIETELTRGFGLTGADLECTSLAELASLLERIK